MNELHTYGRLHEQRRTRGDGVDLLPLLSLGALLAGCLLLVTTPALAQEPACSFDGPFELHQGGAPLETINGHDLKGGDPSVVWNDQKERFEMWRTYGNPSMGVGFVFSTSRDGITWEQVEGGDHGFVMGPLEGTWTANGVETNSVLMKDNTYQMWYYGYPGVDEHGHVLQEPGRRQVIGFAESRDGIHWDRRPDPVLVPEHSWEAPTFFTGVDAHAHGEKGHAQGEKIDYWAGGVYEPTVLWDEEAQLYRMWYGANTYQDVTQIENGEKLVKKTRVRHVAYATSRDGVHWDKHGVVFKPVAEIVGEPHGSATGDLLVDWDASRTSTGMERLHADWEQPFSVDHVNVIADPRHGYHMFYFSWFSIGHAYSEDGVHWERNPRNPVVEMGETKEGNILYAMPSAVLKDDGTLYLFLGRRGPTTKGWRGTPNLIGLATTRAW